MTSVEKISDQDRVRDIVSAYLNGLNSIESEEKRQLIAEAGFSNLVFSDDSSFKGLDLFDNPKLIEAAKMFEKVSISFDYKKESHVADLDSGNFTLSKKTVERKPSLHEMEGIKAVVTLSKDEEHNKNSIIEAIQEILPVDPAFLDGVMYGEDEHLLMRFCYDKPYCKDQNFARVFFNLGNALGLISNDELIYLSDLFVLGSDPLQMPIKQTEIGLAFNQSFSILKDKGHDASNTFDYNDNDNALYYVEKGMIQGVVYTSQNHMFLVARDTDSGIVKVWNTMVVKEEWDKVISSYITLDSNQCETFDVAEYLQSFVNAKYSNRYVYPFEFNSSPFRNSVNQLMEGFNQINDNLIYDSSKGFMPTEVRYFERLWDEVDYGIEVLTCNYNIEQDTIILSSIDINSPEYLIRKLGGQAFFYKSRSFILFYLFAIGGNNFRWNGSTFTNFDNSGVYLDYPENPVSLNYEPLKVDGKLIPDTYALLFNMPSTLSDMWKDAVFEMAFYLKEWIESDSNLDVDIAVRQKVEQLYLDYCNSDILNTIYEHRKSD